MAEVRNIFVRRETLRYACPACGQDCVVVEVAEDTVVIKLKCSKCEAQFTITRRDRSEELEEDFRLARDVDDSPVVI